MHPSGPRSSWRSGTREAWAPYERARQGFRQRLQGGADSLEAHLTFPPDPPMPPIGSKRRSACRRKARRTGPLDEEAQSRYCGGAFHRESLVPDGPAVALSWHLAPASTPTRMGNTRCRGACRGATPMLSATELRTLARRTLDAGTLPNRPPDRTSSGPGISASCIVCQVPIPDTEVEYELQYVRNGGDLRFAKFHCHIRCAAALELVRGEPAPANAEYQASRRDEADDSPKATAVTVSNSTGPSGVERRPFTLSGPITWWSPGTRALSILDRNVQVAPHVSLLGLELGVSIVVAGYHDPPTGQMVVTRLLLA